METNHSLMPCSSSLGMTFWAHSVASSLQKAVARGVSRHAETRSDGGTACLLSCARVCSMNAQLSQLCCRLKLRMTYMCVLDYNAI